MKNYLLAISVISVGLLSGPAAAQDRNNAIEVCADFEGAAGTQVATPLNWMGFRFEWPNNGPGHIMETSAIGGDYLREYGTVTITPPVLVGAIKVRVLSEGESTTHDFELSIWDAAGEQLDMKEVHVAAKEYADITFEGSQIAELQVAAANGEQLNESGVQKVCIWFASVL